MSDRLQELAVFVRVAETGSFSRAARESGMAQPTVSRIIGALEARLGVKLLLRTTRKVAPTEAGMALLARAHAALDAVKEAEDAARGTDSLSGVLRVATPVTFGAREIAPRLGPFLAAHPALRVELLMADRRVDLLDEGVDLAIRLGPLDSSSLIARRLATAPLYLVAAPSYLAERGEPRSPAELAQHDIVAPRAPGQEVWSLRDQGGGETSIKLTARLVATSTEGVVAAAVAGLGIAIVSAFGCRHEIARGALVRVLADYTIGNVDVHALMPSGRSQSARVRAFIAFLGAELTPVLR